MLLDVWYDRRRRLLLSSRVDICELFGRGGQELAHEPSREAPVTSVRAKGGSSSSWLTTFVSSDVEWSATGRADASLASIAAVQLSIGQRRAASRLSQMLRPSGEYEDEVATRARGDARLHQPH